MTLLAFGLIYLGLLLLLAVISATETAILTTREVGVRALAAQSDQVRRQIQSITSNPFPHLHRALAPLGGAEPCARRAGAFSCHRTDARTSAGARG